MKGGSQDVLFCFHDDLRQLGDWDTDICGHHHGTRSQILGRIVRYSGKKNIFLAIFSSPAAWTKDLAVVSGLPKSGSLLWLRGPPPHGPIVILGNRRHNVHLFRDLRARGSVKLEEEVARRDVEVGVRV